MKEKIKIVAIFIGCFLFRLLPFRAPNVEPLMAGIMPISRKYGAFFAFFFGFLSIFLYDAVTHVGSWTWTVGITYGLVGIASYFYFNKFKTSVLNFVIFAFFATITFDFVTGVMFAPMFGESYFTAFVLQMQFTLLHLAGSIGFAVTLSPILNKWINKEHAAAPKKLIEFSFVK